MDVVGLVKFPVCYGACFMPRLGPTEMGKWLLNKVVLGQTHLDSLTEPLTHQRV